MRDEAHAILDRLLEAVDRALWEPSPDAQISARNDARRLWVDLTRSVDRENVLSEAYRERADPDSKSKDEFALNVAALVLSDQAD